MLLTFKVSYENEEQTFPLSGNLTVLSLKTEISVRTGIPLGQIIIDGWLKIPEDDAQHLRTCCRISDDNHLTLLTPSLVQEHEREVTLSFTEYFMRNFDTRAQSLQVLSLESVISQHCSSSSEKVKIVVLYFHSKAEPFSESFCTNIVHSEVQKIFKDKFFLLGWNISDAKYRPSLKSVLCRAGLGNYTRFIEDGIPAALLIVPDGESVRVHSWINGPDITKNEILSALNSAKDFDKNNNFGSTQFQQLMLNLMGDRDYVSYEASEHKHLKRNIGYALFGPPQQENGEYEEAQIKKISSLFSTILRENNKIAKWENRVVISTIYNCTEPLPTEKAKRAKKYADYNPETDLSPVTIFVLRKCKNVENPCRIFIDDIGRVYQSWEEYLKRNKLPECVMVLPKSGRYDADPEGNIILERQISPAAKIDEKILRVADIGSAVGGVGSGLVFVASAFAAPAVLVTAGVVGLGVGGYSIGRSIYNLVDRGRHEQTLSFANSEARGAYLNIAAGALGFVGAGASMTVSKLAASGFNIGEGASAAVNVLNGAVIAGSGIGVASAAYDVFSQWYKENRKPSLLTIVQLSSSILFFGHSIYNFRTVGAIVEEAQTSTLRSYNDSLRSNRQRKMLNKFTKETIRQNSGNVRQGRSEVISSLKNMPNKDETFAFFTRNNKAMNKNGVKFAAKDGGITLNGIAVDMNQMVNMRKTEVLTFLTQLPNTPNPTLAAQIQTMKTRLQFLQGNISVTDLAGLALTLVKLYGAADQDITQRVVNIVEMLVKFLSNQAQAYIMKELGRIFPEGKLSKLFEVAGRFLQSLVNDLEEKFIAWFKRESAGEGYFRSLPADAARRAKEFFKNVVKDYFTGYSLNEKGWRKFLGFFNAWFAEQEMVFEQNEERKTKRKNNQTAAPKEKCATCGGFYYNKAKREKQSSSSPK